MHVADDGARDHHHRGAAQRLNDAAGDQPGHVGGERADQRAQKEQAKAGVKPEMIRLSVGIEAIEDLVDDLQQALASTQL